MKNLLKFSLFFITISLLTASPIKAGVIPSPTPAYNAYLVSSYSKILIVVFIIQFLLNLPLTSLVLKNIKINLKQLLKIVFLFTVTINIVNILQIYIVLPGSTSTFFNLYEKLTFSKLLMIISYAPAFTYGVSPIFGIFLLKFISKKIFKNELKIVKTIILYFIYHTILFTLIYFISYFYLQTFPFTGKAYIY